MARSPSTDSDSADGATSPAKRLRYVVLVVLPLAAVLALIFFGYRHYQESRTLYLNESYLRVLGSLAEQTEGTINGLSAAVDQAMFEWERQATVFNREPAKISTQCAAICKPDGAIKGLLQLSGLKIPDVMPVSSAPTETAKIQASVDIQRRRQTRARDDRNSSAMRLEPVDSAGASLLFCRTVPEAVRQAAIRCGVDPIARLCARKDLGELVRTRLGTDFEALDVFVVDDRGEVLFSSARTGRRYLAVRNSLSGADATALSKALPGPDEIGAATVVRTVTIDDTAYRVFTHPLRLETGGSQDRNWAVVAAVPIDRMEAERRVPLIVLGGIPLVIALAVLLLPILKLATMGAREALTRSTVFGAAVAVLLGASFTTTALLAWLAYGQVRQVYDAELGHFAGIVARNFAAELDAAYKQLAFFRDRRRTDPSLFSTDGSYLSCENALNPKTARCRRYAEAGATRLPRRCDGSSCDESRVARLAADLRTDGSSYPAWSFLVVTDAAGTQREKWTRQSVNTATFDMSPYTAFTDVKDGALLALDGDPKRRYALNVMASPNTGQVLSILSVPLDTNGSFRGAAMMVADFGSVSDPLMSSDMGFAIIARSGQVLFHSNDRLRLYENFFTEVGDADQLRAAVFASRGGFFDIDYHGQPQRMLLRPLADSDWSLVVFRDRDGLRMLIVEATLIAAVLDVVLVVLYLVWLAGARALLGPGLSAAVWPDPRALARYRLLLPPLAGLLLWSVLILRSPDPNGQLLATVTAALIAFSATLLVLALGQARSIRAWLAGAAVLLALIGIAAWISVRLLPLWGVALWIGVAVLLFAAVSGWEPSWIPDVAGERSSTIRLHGAVAVLLLLNLSVLPAVVVIRDAVAAGGVGLMRVRQLVLADRLATHRHRAEEALNSIRGTDTADSPAMAEFWAGYRGWTEPGLIAFRHIARQLGAPPVANDTLLPIGYRLMNVADALDLCHESDMAPPACRLGETGTARADDGAALRCQLLARHPTAPLVDAFALRIFLRESLERRYTAYDRASNCSWADLQGTRSQFNLDVRSKAQRRLLLPNWDIGLRVPGRSSLILLGLTSVALLLGALALTHWVVRRVFCVEAWDAPDPGTAIAAGRGRYYLRPPLAERARLRQWAVDGAVVDLSTCDRAADVDAKAKEIAAAGPVLVLHWEHGAADPEWRLATLRLLEQLERRGQWVDLVSEIDILPYLTSPDRDPSETTPELIARWAQLLEQLDKQRTDLPAAPLPPRTGQVALLYDECRWTPRLLGIRAAITADARWTALTAAALLRHIGDLAEPHYRRIWAHLSNDERVTLWHLARDGFVNPHAAAMARDLLRRGLIRRTPALEIINESFRQFVLTVEDRATLRAWEQAAGASTWSWLRNGVLALVVVGGVLLFVTQPESYTRWVGLLGAVTTIGGGMTQVFGLFQTRRSGSS